MSETENKPSEVAATLQYASPNRQGRPHIGWIVLLYASSLAIHSAMTCFHVILLIDNLKAQNVPRSTTLSPVRGIAIFGICTAVSARGLWRAFHSRIAAPPTAPRD